VATKSFTAAGLQSGQSSTAPDPKHAPSLANASATRLQDLATWGYVAPSETQVQAVFQHNRSRVAQNARSPSNTLFV